MDTKLDIIILMLAILVIAVVYFFFGFKMTATKPDNNTQPASSPCNCNQALPQQSQQDLTSML